MIRRRGKVWHYDVTVNGQRLRGSCDTGDKSLAQAFAGKIVADAYKAEKFGTTSSARDTSLAEACRWFLDNRSGRRYADGAQRDHLAAMRSIIGDATPLSAIDDARISRLIIDLQAERPKAAATINRYLASLQAVCRHAQEAWGVVPAPWQMKRHRKAEPSGREVFLDYDQARNLYETIVPHARAIVLLALLTGLRKDNILGLRGTNVSLDLGRLVLQQKGGRPFSVPLVPMGVDVLRDVRADEAGAGFVFRYPGLRCECAHCLNPANAGRQIKDIRTSLATAASRAGLGHLKLRFHDLRHTFASLTLAETGDLRLVSAALGHSNIKTTMRYSHLLPGRREQAAAAVADRLAGVGATRERGAA